MSIFYAIISSFWFEVLIRLILGFLLAGFIGAERESVNKPAGFKTHSLIGVSAVLIMLCGEYLSNNYSVDASRIPAQLLSGIGFIGAGTILRDGFNVKRG
jgi:putative Mg2+ transporter-C (MgtC) family protein